MAHHNQIPSEIIGNSTRLPSAGIFIMFADRFSMKLLLSLLMLGIVLFCNKNQLLFFVLRMKRIQAFAGHFNNKYFIIYSLGYGVWCMQRRTTRERKRASQRE